MASTAGIRHGLLAVATSCIAAAYLWSGQWLVLPALALVGVGWILIRRNSKAAASMWLLAGTTALAALAVVMGLSMILIVVGVVAALAAWDLAQFEATLQASAREVDQRRLIHRHVNSLLPAVGSGALLALLASIAHLELPFAAAAALALIIVVSLTRAGQLLMGASGG